MTIDKRLKITMSRRELSKLLLATQALSIMGESCAGSATEWTALHDEIQKVLEAYDDICFQRKKEEET